MELPTITSSVEVITPAEAKKHLTKRVNQRPIKPAKIKLYTKLMNEGKWGMGDSNICFDVHGNLLNGQNRLLALVEHGKPIAFTVARGLPTDSFYVMDQGAKRSGGDTLASIGFTNWQDCAAIGRAIMSIKYDGKPGRNSTDQRDLAEFCDPRSEYIEEAAELARLSRSIFPASHTGALLYQALKIDEAKAREFAQRFADGTAADKDDPILKCRNKLMALKGRDRNVRPEVALPIFITAWEAFLAGRLISSLVPAKRYLVKGLTAEKL